MLLHSDEDPTSAHTHCGLSTVGVISFGASASQRGEGKAGPGRAGQGGIPSVYNEGLSPEKL